MSAMMIVGGGAIGSALALAAKNAIWLDASSPPSAGRCYALNAASFDFLTDSAGTPPPEFVSVNRFLLCAGGRTHRLIAENDSPLCRIVGEEILQKWLRDALQNKGAKMHSDAPISLTAKADCIRAKMPDGREFESEVAAIADGARSAAAKMQNVGAAISFFGQRAIVARLKVPELESDSAAQWFARRDILALLPSGDGAFSLIWSLPESRAHSLLAAKDAAAVAKAAADQTGFSIVPADDNLPRSFALTSSRRAIRAAHRTAFVGDAARTIHPLAGQGLNAGLADCKILLQCLHRNASAEDALAEYAKGGMRGELLHGMTSLMNCWGGFASPLFAAASCRPFNKWAARIANC